MKMTLLANAKNLRKKSTPGELKLWINLRSRRFIGLKFRRQCPLGSYIVDFVCIEKKLIIELDGGQHNEDAHQEYDKHRTEFLNGLGFTVLRFWNNEILLQFDAVMDRVYEQVCNGV
jgi:very-short-patch-repair endonuclease